MPLLSDEVRPIQQMRGGSEGRELAGRVHQVKRIGGSNHRVNLC